MVDGEQLLVQELSSTSKSTMRKDSITGEYVADHTKSALVDTTADTCLEERGPSKDIAIKRKVGDEFT